MEGLLAHCDTKKITREKVYSVPTPERTLTWGVVGHGQFIDALLSSIDNHGYNIQKDEYSLSQDGGKMFGVFTLDTKKEDLTWTVGFRNSINKTMKLGITAGTKVMVCDNMAFSGDFITFRKHTGGLTPDVLNSLVMNAVQSLPERLTGFEKWHRSLKDATLTRQDKEALAIRAVEEDLIPGGRFGTFHKLFFQKQNDENDAIYQDDLFGFHGAITQMWSKNSLVGAGEKHSSLQRFITKAQHELNSSGQIVNKQPGHEA